MFCEIRCLSFVSILKRKTMSKKLEPDMSSVSSNNESEVPAKNEQVFG